MLTFTHQFGPGAYMSLKFSGKPSEAVRAVLKSWGCRWSPASGEWWRGKVSGGADLVEAVRKCIDREAGIRRPDGACWICKAEAGFFRNRGAAAPLWCDACDSRVKGCEDITYTLAGARARYSEAYARTKFHPEDMEHARECEAFEQSLPFPEAERIRERIDAVFAPAPAAGSAPFVPDRFDLDVEDRMAAACGL